MPIAATDLKQMATEVEKLPPPSDKVSGCQGLAWQSLPPSGMFQFLPKERADIPLSFHCHICEMGAASVHTVRLQTTDRPSLCLA